MQSRSSNKPAVVTGASSGIGLELARQFTEAECYLVVAAEDDAIHAAARELEGVPRASRRVQVDLADASGVDELDRRIEATGPPWRR